MRAALVASIAALSVGASGCYTYYLRGREAPTVSRGITTDPQIVGAGDWTVFGSSVDDHPPHMGGFPPDQNLRLLECNGEPFLGAPGDSPAGSPRSATGQPAPAARGTRAAAVAPPSADTLVRQALPALRAQGGLLSVGCKFKRSGVLQTQRIRIGVNGELSTSSFPAPSPYAPVSEVAFTATLVAPAREVAVYRAPSRLNGMWMFLGGMTILSAPVVAFVPGSRDGTNPRQHPGAGAVVGAVGVAMFLGGLYGFLASRHPKPVD